MVKVNDVRGWVGPGGMISLAFGHGGACISNIVQVCVTFQQHVNLPTETEVWHVFLSYRSVSQSQKGQRTIVLF